MPSVSSLLRSAEATQKKVRQQEDAVQAYIWESSAQTYDDFVEYQKHLNNRLKTVTDPSDALSYQTKLRSANRTFTSNEIQRQQMAIMEGRGSTQTKMDAVYALWQRAMGTEDYNLAQNLASQWDTLSVKLQNEQEQAAKDAQARMSDYAANNKKAVDKLFKNLEDGVNDITLPDGSQVTPLSAIKRDIEANGVDEQTWQAAQQTMMAMRNIAIEQYNAATTQDEVDKLEQKYGPGLADIDKGITFNFGGAKLSTQDVFNAAINEQFNNPIYSVKSESKFNPATGKYENSFTLKENNVERIDFARRINPQTGAEEYMPVEVRTNADKLYFGNSDQGRGLNTQITNEGQIIGGELKDKQGYGNVALGSKQVQRNDAYTLGERLKQLGIVASHDGTTLKILLPGESIERRATIQPDGSIRYIGDDGQVKEFGLVDRNLGTEAAPMQFKAGEVRTVAFDEISDFGTKSAFGGNIASMSQQGQNYTQSILGKTNFTQPLPSKAPIRVGNDFTGFGGPAMGQAFQGTTAVLQGGAQTRQAIEAQRQEAARQQALMLQAQQRAAEQLQASRTFNLNQTPVQQFASNGVLRQQLRVAPIVTPRISSVGVLQPTQRITTTSVAPRTQNITGVSVAPAQPRIRL